jgi:hypothetical protein
MVCHGQSSESADSPFQQIIRFTRDPVRKGLYSIAPFSRDVPEQNKEFHNFFTEKRLPQTVYIPICSAAS